MAKSYPVSATGQVITGSGTISGVIVSSNSSGTLKLVDSPNGTSGRLILDTYTFGAGSSVVNFGKDVEYYEGLYATVGGTASLELIITPLS